MDSGALTIQAIASGEFGGRGQRRCHLQGNLRDKCVHLRHWGPIGVTWGESNWGADGSLGVHWEPIKVNSCLLGVT